MGVHAYPRRSRLLKPSEFQRVFDQAVVSSDPLFRVLARAFDGPQSRLGMAVSRKVDPRATGRNRIRRLIRESFRLNHPLEQGATAGKGLVRTPARDYVVLAAPPAATAANARISESLARHWREIDRKLTAAPRTGNQESESEK